MMPLALMSPITALEGVRVLDVTQVMAGPFCTMMLADLGADVIKVEPPGGDMTRRMPGAVGTDTPAYNAVNRGKRSVVLDLKAPAGREAILRLARSADVFVENSRPGAMAALGLDYPSLAGINPALIYASISGFGHTGPDRARGGLDLIAQGVSGMLYHVPDWNFDHGYGKYAAWQDHSMPPDLEAAFSKAEAAMPRGGPTMGINSPAMRR